ncbi:hypothetical protein CMUS01_14359 [Colletotrichum musicola]|uniref:Ankyrin repeat protein n=1 Tax=Colletotrichum musicola TaxID=2175873 RepID=A0A8H6J5G1_9PEZI|nr:hypothetical protein CMUS01_14359 [Colletotrichum musicola]
MKTVLEEALKLGSFRVAASILCQDAVAESRELTGAPVGRSAWIATNAPYQLGSLSIAAGIRYHAPFRYKPGAEYVSEADFWTWKKRTMEGILAHLNAKFSEAFPHDREARDRHRERELNLALVQAAGADAHSVDAMRFLVKAGADVNAGTDFQFAGQAWHSALDEEAPGLFRAKVDFLLGQGVDVDRVKTFEGIRTPIEFVLRKLRQSFWLSGSVSFVGRALDYVDFLESRGCLRWPRVAIELPSESKGGVGFPRVVVLDMSEAGARELELIMDDEDVSMQKLREALGCYLYLKLRRQSLDGHSVADDLVVKCERTLAKYRELPPALKRLEELYETWVACEAAA